MLQNGTLYELSIIIIKNSQYKNYLSFLLLQMTRGLQLLGMFFESCKRLLPPIYILKQ